MRWIFRIVGVLILAALVLVGALFMLPAEKIAKIAGDQIEARTGRSLTFSGDVSITLWPVLGVKTGPVELGNASWAGSGPMFRAKSLVVGVSAPELLTGTIKVNEILSDGPELYLVTNASGQRNWEFTEGTGVAPAAAEGDAAGTPAMTLDRLVMTNAHLSYAPYGADPIVIKRADMELNWPDRNGPMTVVSSLHMDGTPIDLTAKVDPFLGFLSGDVAAVSVDVGVPGGKVSFAGNANLAGAAKGAFAVMATDTEKLAELARMGKSDLPPGLGKTAEFNADVTYTTDGRISLRGLNYKSDGNHVAGDADIVLSTIPQITAELTAGDLNIAAMMEGGDSGKPEKSGKRAGRIDTSPLEMMQGTISFSANSIDTGDLKLGATKAILHIDDGRAVLRFPGIEVYGGALSGEVTVNSRDGLSVAGNVDAKGISLAEPLAKFAGISGVSGKATSNASFTGSGDTAKAILKSLDMSGAVDIEAGGLSGISSGMAGSGRIKAGFSFTEGKRIALRDLVAALDNNRITGTANVVLSEVPKITANLNAGDLDFSSLTGGSGGGTAAPAGSGWSKDKIDASGLGLVEADISLTANSINTGMARLGATTAEFTIKDARAVLKLTEAAAYGGSLTGQVVANARNGFSVGGDITAKGVEMQQVLQEFAGIERVSGKANTSLKFLGSGNSVDAIMRSLSGGGEVKMKRGVISGIDLDKLMRSGSGTGGTTVFDKLGATYTIEEGNLQNNDLLVELGSIQAEGAGRIGLGDQDIDYLFTPTVVKAESGQRLSIPVRVRGPWSGPSILPDLSQALQSEIDLKTDELEKKAKKELRKKLKQDLGVKLDKDKSTEDAIKDAIKDKAEEELQRLLGVKKP